MSQIEYQKAHWARVGTGLFCPVAVGLETGHLFVLVRGASGDLFYREWAGDWSKFYSLGVPAAQNDGAPAPVLVDWHLAACSGDPARIDLFARSPDGELLHMARNGGSWGTFECLGAPAAVQHGMAIPMGLASPPAACSAGSERLDVFAIGQGGEVLHTSWEGGNWTPFDSLGIPSIRRAGTPHPVPVSGPLAACRCGRDRMAVFLRGAAGDLVMKWWDGARWSEFASLGMPEVPDEIYPAVTVGVPLTGHPAACSWGPERMDVFARGPRGELLHKWWDGKDWSPFESLGMPLMPAGDQRCIPFTGSVTACTWGPGRLDVFARALDGTLYHAWWDGTWDHG
jgi:hypothetical protein